MIKEEVYLSLAEVLKKHQVAFNEDLKREWLGWDHMMTSEFLSLKRRKEKVMRRVMKKRRCEIILKQLV